MSSFFAATFWPRKGPAVAPRTGLRNDQPKDGDREDFPSRCKRRTTVAEHPMCAVRAVVPPDIGNSHGSPGTHARPAARGTSNRLDLVRRDEGARLVTRAPRGCGGVPRVGAPLAFCRD